jgi:hypothetical protein
MVISGGIPVRIRRRLRDRAPRLRTPRAGLSPPGRLAYALPMTPDPQYLRATLGPAAGVGVVAAIVAAQEGASVLAAATVAVVITGVITGMIALKRRFWA